MTTVNAKWIQSEKKSRWAGQPNIVNQGYDDSVGHKVFELGVDGLDGSRSEMFGYWKGISYSFQLFQNGQHLAEMIGDTFEVRVQRGGAIETHSFKRMGLANRTCEKTGQPVFVWVCSQYKEMYRPFLRNIRNIARS